MATNRNQERTRSERAEGREPVLRRTGREERGMGRKLKDKAGEMVESRKHQAADRIHDVGDRLESRGESLEAQGGVKGRAGRVVHGAGERVERGADYLDEHRFGEIRNDAKTQIREHPFRSVGTALGTGFALGWITGKMGESEEEEVEDARFDGARERDTEKGGAMGRVGRMLLTGATAMAARGIRDRIAGPRHRA